MELSERLRQIRKENNLTQQQLADELCLSRTVITKFEKGYKVPNLSTLIMISNYFETNIFDEYKNKIKLFILSIKCVIPYLISLMLLIISILGLMANTISITNKYGYNIYDDELKVKNSEEVYIVKYNYSNQGKKNTINCEVLNNVYSNNNLKTCIINCKYIESSNNYYLIFLDNQKNDLKGNQILDISISNKPFIYPLKDYDESLPYNEQTGECSKILNYYINLIEKVK